MGLLNQTLSEGRCPALSRAVPALGEQQYLSGPHVAITRILMKQYNGGKNWKSIYGKQTGRL